MKKKDKKFDVVIHFETICSNEEYTVKTEVVDYYNLDVLDLYNEMNSLLGLEISRYFANKFVSFRVDNVHAYVHLPNGKYFILRPEQDSE